MSKSMHESVQIQHPAWCNDDCKAMERFPAQPGDREQHGGPVVSIQGASFTKGTVLLGGEADRPRLFVEWKDRRDQFHHHLILTPDEAESLAQTLTREVERARGGLPERADITQPAIAYSMVDAAAAVGLDANTLRDAIHDGSLPAAAIGSRILIEAGDLRDWVKSRHLAGGKAVTA